MGLNFCSRRGHVALGLPERLDADQRPVGVGDLEPGTPENRKNVGAAAYFATTCKTWGCASCRERLVQLFRMRVQYGCSALKSSWLITLTLRLGSTGVRDASFVNKAWRKFWVLYRQLDPEEAKRVAWFKVIESTKKGQPHLHLVAGGLTGTKSTIQRRWRKLWLEASGDSYIVDVRKVWSSYGAGSYLSKYLSKGVDKFNELRKLGFERRWSRSRNWPTTDMELRATHEDAWTGQTFWGGKVNRDSISWMENAPGQPASTHPLLEYIGSATAAAWDITARAKRYELRLQSVKGMIGT
ncbi:MAG TPA: hypothetical protein EYM97_06760 [Gemmatimonadetes bacterium]|nr:hypothetical protein [Gemmatimonadota bacterium]